MSQTLHCFPFLLQPLNNLCLPPLKSLTDSAIRPSFPIPPTSPETHSSQPTKPFFFPIRTYSIQYAVPFLMPSDSLNPTKITSPWIPMMRISFNNLFHDSPEKSRNSPTSTTANYTQLQTQTDDSYKIHNHVTFPCHFVDQLVTQPLPYKNYPFQHFSSQTFAQSSPHDSSVLTCIFASLTCTIILSSNHPTLPRLSRSFADIPILLFLFAS